MCEYHLCLCDRVRKPRVALNFLKMALQMEKNSSQITGADLASTYLNLCAIYSELGQHQESINKSVKSVLLVRSHLKKLSKTQHDDLPYNDLERVIKEGESRTEIKHGPNKDRLAKGQRQLGEDICTAGNSIDQDHDLLKLGKNLTGDLSKEYSMSYVA